jgi:hypothetical protein
MICSKTRRDQQCPTRAAAMASGEMAPNYRVGHGWAWPVRNGYASMPPYAFTFCPWCGQELPPMLSDEALLRLWRAIEGGELQQPGWLPNRSQADGEGEE